MLKSTSIFLFLLFLVLASSVFAADVEVVLQSDKPTYNFGEEIKITVTFEGQDVTYPFNVIGPSIFLDVSDDLVVDVLNGYDSGGQNIYSNHLASGAKSPSLWEFASKVYSTEVTAQKNILGSFVVRSIGEGEVEFKLNENSKMTSAFDRDGRRTFYTLESVPLVVSVSCDGECPAVLEPLGEGVGSGDDEGESGDGLRANGYICNSRWDCSAWSGCNSGEKMRSCSDLNRCREEKTETLPCSDRCQESWACSSWSSCSGGKERRDCSDENSCGTESLKPNLIKNCGEADGVSSTGRSGNSGGDVSDEGLWDNYKGYIVGIPAGLSLIALVIFIIMHFVQKPPEV
jgi:hypothetical protein